jgi:peptidoglycan-associated lipoprotein
LLALTLLVDGCKKPKPVVEAPKPVTATLSANPSSIVRGQSATLSWSTTNADDVSLDGSKVDPNGSQSVSPSDTTTYHLHAKGGGGTQDATATVTVTAPPTPTPTPTPRPTPPPITDEQLFAQNVQDVYFDYDKSDIRADQQATIARNAEFLKAHPSWKVQIEGNCDERGSTEYNLALGERRADSAKQSLVRAGVSADTFKTISYGKEKPVCSASNEDCWQQNRHDHFVLLSH